MMILRSRSRSARALLAVGGALGATLLGAGVSQAQGGFAGAFACPPAGSGTIAPACALYITLPVSGTALASYPNPAVAYYSNSSTALGSLYTSPTPVFAYSPTYGSAGWYSSVISSTWGTTTPASTTPALVVQNAQTSTLSGAAGTTSSAVAACPPDPSTATPAPVTGLTRYSNQYGYTSGIRVLCTPTSNQTISVYAGIGGVSPADSWSATGTASTTATSNYSLADPTLDYSVVGSSGSWKYSATAKTARQQTVNWHYKGYHAWYQVSVAIEKFVIRNGTEIVTETLRSAGPVNCCTSPSGGFDYTGTTTFDLQPGDVYGFRMSGSHQDSDQRLIGTLSLDLPGYQRPVQTRCAAPAVGFGFSVRAGDVIDAVSLECAVPGSHSASPMVGGTGGIPKGTALCPKGYALTGLQGTVNNTWFNALNVVGLTGVCTHYPDSGLGATGAGVLAYKGTSPKGAVKFIVAPKKGKALGAGKSGWDYTLGGFAFATGCSRASAKVPGKVAVFARGSAGQATRFSLTAGRFSITGRLSGALRKPKVSGTLKILTGACKGRTLRFTATASR